MSSCDSEDSSRLWVVNAVRNYSPVEKKIDVATFFFGRNFDELKPSEPRGISRLMSVSRNRKTTPESEMTNIRKLPSGLISLLENSNLTEEALEVGFQVQMTILNKEKENSWRKFVIMAECNRGFGYSIRANYVEIGTTNSVEFISIDPWAEKMPTCIWIRVTELPEETLAAVIAEGILSHTIGMQTTLDEFFDLDVESEFSNSLELPLPGPPWEGCGA